MEPWSAARLLPHPAAPGRVVLVGIYVESIPAGIAAHEHAHLLRLVGTARVRGSLMALVRSFHLEKRHTVSSGVGIRTPISGSKVRCPAIGRRRKKSGQTLQNPRENARPPPRVPVFRGNSGSLAVSASVWSVADAASFLARRRSSRTMTLRPSVQPWHHGCDLAPPTPIEQRLIERLVARDERAFNELVRAYERRVFALVLRMLGNRAEAEDLAQEVFVQVFKAIGSFRGDSKLSTWVYRIAVNLCKNRSKYLRVRHAGEARRARSGRGPRPARRCARTRTSGKSRAPTRRWRGKQVEQIVQRAILAARAGVPRVPRPARRRGAELRGDWRDHRPRAGHREEPHPPRAGDAPRDCRARARGEDPMTPEDEPKAPPATARRRRVERGRRDGRRDARAPQALARREDAARSRPPSIPPRRAEAHPHAVTGEVLRRRMEHLEPAFELRAHRAGRCSSIVAHRVLRARADGGVGAVSLRARMSRLA